MLFARHYRCSRTTSWSTFSLMLIFEEPFLLYIYFILNSFCHSIWVILRLGDGNVVRKKNKLHENGDKMKYGVSTHFILRSFTYLAPYFFYKENNAITFIYINHEVGGVHRNSKTLLEICYSSIKLCYYSCILRKYVACHFFAVISLQN